MSSLHGPVIFLEDDVDDHAFMVEAYTSLKLKNPWKQFSRAEDLLVYLRTTSEKPMVIISEVNLRGMDGVALRKEVLKDPYLSKKSIPFIFLTSNADLAVVELAYELQVQGYFVKKYSIPEIARMLQKIIDYWTECRHPHNT